MATALDLKGKRFGTLTALERYENDDAGRSQWLCVCDCGGGHVVRGSYLKEGRITRCPSCAEAIRIEAWYHLSLHRVAGGGVTDGSAGFCVASRHGITLIAPIWIDQRRPKKQMPPVLLDAVRRLVAAGYVKSDTRQAAMTGWLKRNKTKVIHHSYNEGHEVWAAWFERTGEWRGPDELKPVNR